MAHFLIGGEADGDTPVGDFFLYYLLAGCHDGGNARLIICTKDGSAIGGDEGVTHKLFQVRVLINTEHPAAVAKLYIAPVVVFNYLGINVFAGEVGNGVQMGDKADAGSVLIALGGGDIAIDIGVLIAHNLLHAHITHFLFQQPCQIKLDGAGGGNIIPVHTGGVDFHISQKFFGSIHIFNILIKTITDGL